MYGRDAFAHLTIGRWWKKKKKENEFKKGTSFNNKKRRELVLQSHQFLLCAIKNKKQRDSGFI